jgi:hypothetical protein
MAHSKPEIEKSTATGTATWMHELQAHQFLRGVCVPPIFQFYQTKAELLPRYSEHSNTVLAVIGYTPHLISLKQWDSAHRA